jgi:hypothetical protein
MEESSSPERRAHEILGNEDEDALGDHNASRATSSRQDLASSVSTSLASSDNIRGGKNSDREGAPSAPHLQSPSTGWEPSTSATSDPLVLTKNSITSPTYIAIHVVPCDASGALLIVWQFSPGVLLSGSWRRTCMLDCYKFLHSDQRHKVLQVVQIFMS